MDARLVKKRRGGKNSELWQRRIPAEILAKVFGYLNKDDICRAGTTCCHWRSVFYLPEFWRKKTFRFSGNDMKEGAVAAGYMQTYGSHLKHLKVKIARPFQKKNARIVSYAMADMITSIPPEMKLQTLKCSGLGAFDERRYDIYRLNIINDVRYLLELGLATGLEKVSLSSNYFNMDGCSILRVLSNGQPTPDSERIGLKVLKLRGCFHSKAHVAVSRLFLEEIGRFAALQTLLLDCCYLSNMVLEHLTRGSPLLESLGLFHSSSDSWQLTHLISNNLFASTESWRAAVQRCPKLQVFVLLYLMGIYAIDLQVERVLSPEMPLVSIGVKFRPRSMTNYMTNLLQHVTDHFSRSLRYLFLRSYDPSVEWSRPMDLIQLTEACPYLSILSMQMTLPLDTLLGVAAAAYQHFASIAAPETLRIRLDQNWNQMPEKIDLQQILDINPFCLVEVCPMRRHPDQQYKAVMFD